MADGSVWLWAVFVVRIPSLLLWRSECADVKNYKWQLNPVWHRMLYSCTHMATVGIKGFWHPLLPDEEVIASWWLVDAWSVTQNNRSHRPIASRIYSVCVVLCVFPAGAAGSWVTVSHYDVTTASDSCQLLITVVVVIIASPCPPAS